MVGVRRRREIPPGSDIRKRTFSRCPPARSLTRASNSCGSCGTIELLRDWVRCVMMARSVRALAVAVAVVARVSQRDREDGRGYARPRAQAYDETARARIAQ